MSYSKHTPMLDQYASDLTAKARKGGIDPVIGRQTEIARAVTILCRRRKNNPVFVGFAGAGKTAVAEGIALRIASGDVPRKLRQKRIMAVEMGQMVAGTQFRGEFEKRIQDLIKEVKECGDVILFIDEIHTVMGAGSSSDSALDASNMFKGALSRGELQLLGATTFDEWRKHIEKDKAVVRRLQQVQVPPSTVAETVEILQGLKSNYEKHHNVSFSDDVIQYMVKVADRYIHTNVFPDKAIDLMDEAGAIVCKRAEELPPEVEELKKKISALREAAHLAESDEKAELCAELNELRIKAEEQLCHIEREYEKGFPNRKAEPVTRQDIASIIKSLTGVDVSSMSEDNARAMLDMENQLHKRVVGQKEAVKAICKAVRRARVGLKDPNRPIGSFLFLGPTGVGKTEVARALAAHLLGSEKMMLRFDMSEYSEQHSVARLIGAPPGYVGFDDGGALTEAVRRTPYCVVLFDEIEKAHPKVWNVLLQILEDGRLTDGQGTLVDFKNVIVIMTSNIGAKNIVQKIRQSSLDFTETTAPAAKDEEIKNDVLRDLKKVMSPELINRIDNVIVFLQLIKEQVRLIIDNLTRTLQAVALENGFEIEITDAAKDYLIEHGGFDPEYGARPMRRAIQSMLEDTLTDDILSARFGKGDKVRTVVRQGKLSWQKVG